MGSLKAVLVLLAAFLLGAGIWYAGAISDEAVSEQFCRDIATGIDDGDAADLTALLADDYDVAAHWPIVVSAAGQVGMQQDDLRTTSRQLLGRWFFTQRAATRTTRCELDDLEPLTGPSQVAHLPQPITADLLATITLGVESDGRAILPTTTIQFWLRRDGSLLRGVRIVAHELVSTHGIR